VFNLKGLFISIFFSLKKMKLSSVLKLFWLDFSMEDGEKPFAADRAKTGRSSCKKCKQKIESGALRIARVQPNPFGGDGGTMKAWHHVACFFAAQAKARASTKKMEQPDEDVQGWDALTKEDQQEILAQLPPEAAEQAKKAPNKTPKSPAANKTPKSPVAKKSPEKSPEKKAASQQSNGEARNFLYLRHSTGQ
jgi:DNA ligase 3